jgi:cytochrome P450
MPAEFDPLSPRWRTDPYPAYQELRETAPVHRAPESGIYCVSRHADVVHVLSTPEVFSSRAMFTMLMNGGRKKGPPLSLELLRFVVRYAFRTGMNPFAFPRARNLIAEDPPVHGPLRSAVNRGFTPRRIADWEPRIRELVEGYMALLRASRRFDLVEELAVPLPVTVIAEMLGVEPTRRKDFKRWSDTIIYAISGPGRDTPLLRAFQDVFIEFNAYLKKIIRQRRRDPADDLVSAILAHEAGGTALSDTDVMFFVQLLMIAGNETTTNLLGNAVHLLLDHPDQLERIHKDLSQVPNLVEEVVRFDPPIQLVFRLATCDTELAGMPIPHGAIVAPLLGSANRDERRFPDAERFDVGRDSRGHVGFGFGNHFCLGASLARLEARVALEALVPELAGLERCGGERELVDSFVVRGPTRLELRRAA